MAVRIDNSAEPSHWRAPVRWGGTVPLLMLVVATGHYNRIGISVAGAERIVPELGVSPERMGLVYSAFLFTYTLAMLPGGWFIDRFGARNALLLLGFSATVFVALTGVIGLVAHEAGSVWLGLMAVRSILGVTNAPLHPSAARMVFDDQPARSRGRANGFVTAAACGGIAASYYVMGTLIDVFGWPVAFLLSSAFTFAVACVWMVRTRRLAELSRFDASATAARIRLVDVVRVMRDRSVVCITLSYAAYGYFQYLFFYWIEYYFETIRRQDAGVARGYSTMITLAMGAGMLGGGWCTDRVPRSFSPRLRQALVPVFGMIASGLVFEAAVLAASPRATLVGFIMAAALLGLCEAGFWTTVVELGGRFGGTAAGLMNTGGNAGGTLSPYLTPLLSGLFAAHYGANSGWRLGLAIAGAVVVAGAALWWGVDAANDLGPSETRLESLNT